VTLTRVVVDSSGWIEVFTDGGQAEHFLALLADESSLVVPAISIFEVFKWILREHGEARDQQARLHTMDSDFRGIPDVEWIEAIS
jgi:uncharacterized protein with PIN domain